MTQKDPAIKYGEALRNALDQGRSRGASQRALAKHAWCDPATVSRYFSGELTAGKAFLEALVSYLAALGAPLSDDQLSPLHQKRREAELYSGQSAARIAYWVEEVELLRQALKAGSAAEVVLLEQLMEAETELDILVGDLAAALQRARVAELHYAALEVKTGARNKQLEHAKRLVQQLETELHISQETLRTLRLENAKLRKLIAELLKVKEIVVEDVEVYRLRRQPGIATYFLDPWRAKNSLEYRKVDSALQGLQREFKAACEYYGVEKPSWDWRKSGQKIGDLTGDGRWSIVGRNVAHLCTIGNELYGQQEARHGEGNNIPPMTPTIETVNSFVTGTDTVLAQIGYLRLVSIRRS
ncbi:hypothetical protein GCM10010205_81240 [Streptomyces nojiriensis]|uniref:hypothetical protein n=1 Tax=Streptomyces nojiriensis TaxID=66374 RepID=UPI001677925F|nr:hypothetical protein [Streptomyces nojiriensis]GGS39270.1 hypothetical protein GCM10010205_81240 [Streptomyces nojiriensis]